MFAVAAVWGAQIGIDICVCLGRNILNPAGRYTYSVEISQKQLYLKFDQSLLTVSPQRFPHILPINKYYPLQ